MGVGGIADESFGIVEVKSALMASKPSIVPPTPDYKRQNGEQIHNFSSPLTLVSSSPPETLSSDSSISNCSVSPIGDGSVTPKDCVFDPFAPGPDKFMLAPLRRKNVEESRMKAVRRLNFLCTVNLFSEMDAEESSTEIASDENNLFESMYHTILDAIVSEQTKEFVEGVPAQDSDGFGTPKSAPRLSWILESCPGAPMKTSNKFRNIDKELCRKLEF